MVKGRVEKATSKEQPVLQRGSQEGRECEGIAVAEREREKERERERERETDRQTDRQTDRLTD